MSGPYRTPAEGPVDSPRPEAMLQALEMVAREMVSGQVRVTGVYHCPDNMCVVVNFETDRTRAPHQAVVYTPLIEDRAWGVIRAELRRAIESAASWGYCPSWKWSREDD